MAYITFQFENSNADQTFTVLDQIDASKNPIFRGPVNHNEISGEIECWKGGDGKGRVTIQGDMGPLYAFDIFEGDNPVRY